MDLSKEKKELTMEQFHEIAETALDKATQACNERVYGLKDRCHDVNVHNAYAKACSDALTILTTAHLRTIIMLFAGQPASVSAFEVGVALNKMIEFVLEAELLDVSKATKFTYQRRLEEFLPEYLNVIAEKFENLGVEEIEI